MKAQTVHLGFEVGSAEAVEVPVRHMAVTGQTQESGKTTTLEALIARSGLPAIAFLTKRGEASMHGRRILPYFQDRADWQFVQSILESTMREKQTVELDGGTLRGRLAILITENFFTDAVNGNLVWKELTRRGVGSAKPNVYRELDVLTRMGFLRKSVEGYQSVAGMKVSKKTIEAAA